MLKNIVVKAAIVVMTMLIVKPVAAADSETIKDKGRIFQPQCFFFVCPPVDPIDPEIPSIRR